jgi:hypothetical protein
MIFTDHDDQSVSINLNQKELTILLMLIESRCLTARKYMSRKKEFKDEFTKTKNKILVQWQEEIDLYLQKNSVKITSKMYENQGM